MLAGMTAETLRPSALTVTGTFMPDNTIAKDVAVDAKAEALRDPPTARRSAARQDLCSAARIAITVNPPSRAGGRTSNLGQFD